MPDLLRVRVPLALCEPLLLLLAHGQHVVQRVADVHGVRVGRAHLVNNGRVIRFGISSYDSALLKTQMNL